MLNLSLQTFHVISEAVKADEHKRRELCRLYDDTREVLNQLDDDFMKTLEKRLGGDLGDFRTTLEENIKNLAPRDQYVVLVAGRELKKKETFQVLQISYNFPSISYSVPSEKHSAN